MKRRGFSLIEVLLSVAIITLLGGLSLPIVISFQLRNDVDIAGQALVDGVRRAQTYSRAGKGGSSWGIRIDATSFTVFKGLTYAGRDATYDEITEFPPTVTITGAGAEVAFNEITGRPNAFGSVVLTAESTTQTVSLNSVGMVNGD